MKIQINYLAVIVAAIASMVLGGIWYGPLFGKTWMKLADMTTEKVDAAKQAGMGQIFFLAFIGSLIMSYVLAHSLLFAAAYYNSAGISAGLMSGFWNWLGFVVPVTLGAVLWEGKPWKFWLLTNGYYLLSLLIMGAILAVWRRA